MVETINKLVRVQRQLLQDLGREPTPDEIGKVMGISAEKVREIQKVSQEPVSLETPIGEEEDSHLGDFIEDSDAVVPVDAASFILLQEQLESVLHTLSEREKKVIQLRFGLVDGHPRTLEEVGREFGVTRERIRQIESKTLSKLRHPSPLAEAPRLPGVVRLGLVPDGVVALVVAHPVAERSSCALDHLQALRRGLVGHALGLRGDGARRAAGAEPSCWRCGPLTTLGSSSRILAASL